MSQQGMLPRSLVTSSERRYDLPCYAPCICNPFLFAYVYPHVLHHSTIVMSGGIGRIKIIIYNVKDKLTFEDARDDRVVDGGRRLHL